MIKLIFIFVVQFASSEPMNLPAHPICMDSNELEYHLIRDIICIPPGTEFRDLIWLNSFEGEEI